MTERWKINRIGFINFWYYDDEEFDFVDGRLLLRGANGSGKSVTMQSVIPLLLDGNKSPSRLDPFGTKARKIENYLIEDGDDIDERTGYLYMEFAKPESNAYMTIGMGLRGVKGRSVDSWGFVVTDGRRIGQDLYLYKEMGGKIPLTRRELQNRLSEGGQVFEAQKEYMSMVNKLLFGYESIDDYDELIKLVVQLRSPKLSKDYKPTVSYEIMSNSLQTLSDEDLMPMSEAIENMDNIKSQLEYLLQSKKGLDRIIKEYDQYNKFVLVEKESRHMDAKLTFERIKRDMVGYEKSKELFEKEEQRCDENLGKLGVEKEALEDKQAKLNAQDIIAIKEELEKTKRNIVDYEADKKRKDGALEEKKASERQIAMSIKKTADDSEVIKEEIIKVLGDMDDASDEFKFDEQRFFSDELLKKIDGAYSFSYVKKAVIDYKKRIADVLEILRETDRTSIDYERKIKGLEDIKKSRDEKNRRSGEAYNLLLHERENSIENMYAWEKGNEIFKIEKENLVKLAQIIENYGEEDTLGEVRERLFTHKSVTASVFDTAINEWKAEINRIDKVINDRRDEIEEWKNKREPEPELFDKVRKNRDRLTSLGVPHIPLYKAIDYKGDIEEKYKGIIEEAFVDMGIINALIVEPKYKAVVLAMDTDMADKYIFAEPNFFKLELSQYLKIEGMMADDINKEYVDNVIKSFMAHDGDQSVPYINEQGEYRLGVVTGKVSGIYDAKYIGIAARKRYKEQMIENLKAEIKKLSLEKEEIQSKIEIIKGKLALLDAEYKAFPSKADLEAANKMYKNAKFEYEQECQKLDKMQAEIDVVYKEIKALKEKIIEHSQKIFLRPIDASTYAQAIAEIEVYNNQLFEVESKHIKYIAKMEQTSSLTTQHEGILDDIDNIIYDAERVQKLIKVAMEKVTNYEKQLELTNYDKIKEEIDYCSRRLREIELEILENTRNAASYKEKATQMLQKIEESKPQAAKAGELAAVYQRSFDAEQRLGYAIFEEGMRSLLKSSKGLTDYSDVLIQTLEKNSSDLRDYTITTEHILGESDISDDKDIAEAGKRGRRIDITAQVQGKKVSIYVLRSNIEDEIEINKNTLNENDRELFEDILANTIAKKIRVKIFHSENWVKKMNALMESMNTSSGLSFSLSWKHKKAETEEQLGTKELVEILIMDGNLLGSEQRDKLSRHFRSKIAEAKGKLEDEGKTKTFHAIMKNLLDYRQWFEFQLHYTREGDKKKELTDNAFFTFSGGEKAMAMYVPLFSAVYARYESARSDCPRIISLDEAFAGVDENNIRDMFRLMVELDLSFIINSQVLYGDYDTVPSLAISELIRPNNAKFVSVIRYRWDGSRRVLV
ncbi:MAG TPA: TIGR02680 family protein [Clostridiales bacterium]|nr:MAG: TIGR02680 family protein [Clostridiales bacterium GWD2_32_59]HAN09323.1 TIGR02680 family protein [Clostridiales bacterium]